MRITITSSAGAPLAEYDNVRDPQKEYDFFYSKEVPGAAGWQPWQPSAESLVNGARSARIEALVKQVTVTTLISSVTGVGVPYCVGTTEDRANLLLAGLEALATAGPVSVLCGDGVHRDHTPAQLRQIIVTMRQAFKTSRSTVNSATWLLNQLTDVASINAAPLG